ncbi:MAG: hydrogenase maturation nickel metallochaperone HypA [Spirochaetales bacterium]|nr:hydrogenase maturation nickel metallochaperone HypA [Spirochaetales bacterium]
MHEFSLCGNLVEAVVSEYEKLSPRPKRLIAAHIVVGGLHQIVPESLETAFEVLTKDTVAESSRLIIDVVPIVCRCNACGKQAEITYPVFLCGHCGAPDLETITGNEMYLEKLEVEYNNE